MKDYKQIDSRSIILICLSKIWAKQYWFLIIKFISNCFPEYTLEKNI